MTKRDCIDVCAITIKRIWAKFPSSTDFNLRQSAFNECKELCSMLGYSGQSFYDIWSKAIDKFEEE